MSEADKTPQESKKSFKEKIFTIFPPLSILGIILGTIGGYLYYLKVGCVNGTCAITSNPWLSMLWGAALGYLLFDMFNKKKKELKKTVKDEL